MAITQNYGTGRRKSAVARVFLRPGTGNFEVNARPLETYFPNELHRMVVKAPLTLTESVQRFDVKATVKGGGNSGQAGAIRHGVARALLQNDIETKKKLRDEGFLTRDARIKERKKYGQPGARKKFQFSKR